MLFTPARSVLGASAGGGGSDTPNRPNGLTTVFGHSFTAGTYAQANNGAANGASTGRLTVYGANGVGFDVVADAAAALSADYVAHRFPSGHVYGTEPCTLDAWADETSGDGSSYATLYSATWFRMRTGGTGGQLAYWELVSAGPGIKAGGFWASACRGTGNPPNQVIVFFEGNAANATALRPHLTMQVQGMSDQVRYDMTAGAVADDPYPIKLNTWHRLEALFELGTLAAVNATTARGDGRARLWLDGALVLDATDVGFRNATFPSGFYGRRHSYVLGGDGAGSKSKIDYVDLSHEVIAVGAVVSGG